MVPPIPEGSTLLPPRPPKPRACATEPSKRLMLAPESTSALAPSHESPRAALSSTGMMGNLEVLSGTYENS